MVETSKPNTTQVTNAEYRAAKHSTQFTFPQVHTLLFSQTRYNYKHKVSPPPGDDETVVIRLASLY